MDSLPSEFQMLAAGMDMKVRGVGGSSWTKSVPADVYGSSLCLQRAADAGKKGASCTALEHAQLHMLVEQSTMLMLITVK